MIDCSFSLTETHCQYNRDFLGRNFSCRDFPDSEFRCGSWSSYL